MKLLADWGLVEINTGRPTLVRQVRAAKEKVPNTADSGRPAKAARHAATAANEGSEPLDLELRRLGEHVYSMRVNANPDDAQMRGCPEFRGISVAARVIIRPRSWSDHCRWFGQFR